MQWLDLFLGYNFLLTFILVIYFILLLFLLWTTILNLMILQDSEPRGARIESHTATMTRRELFSAWLEEGVQKVADDRVRAAREKSDHLGTYIRHGR